MDIHAVDVRVTGRVQGVFFRAACEREAHRLGVSGWAGNEPDGSVAGHFEGTREAVEALVAWCRSGPPAARVDDVTVTLAEGRGAAGFHTR